MSFDPDQFLAESKPSQSFNPDSFLAETEGMEPPTPKPRPEVNLEALKTLPPKKEGEEPREAKTFLEAWEAGFQVSVGGLILRGRNPELVLPEDAPMYHRIASQVSTIGGDFPAMVGGVVAGSVAGGSVGTAIAPGVGTAIGTVLGAGFGSEAVPTAIRESLMAAYEDGSVDSFSEFWEKASPVMIETLKRGTVGAVTLGVGSKVTKVVKPIASPLLEKVAVATSEIATLTTVGSALDGRVPEPKEFMDAAVIVGGIHGAVAVGGKLRKTYGKTGITPDQVIKEADTSPTIKEDLNSSNIDVPRILDETPKNDVTVKGDLGAKSNVIDDGTPVKLRVEETVDAVKKESAEAPKKSEILDRIGEDPKKSGLTVDGLIQDALDDLDPINRAVKEAQGKLGDKALPASENPYLLARNLRGVQGLVSHFVEAGTVDYATGQKVGKSLKEILKPFNKDIDGFTEFALAKRAVELHQRQIKTGIDATAAEKVVKNGKKYEKAFQELQDYQNSVLKYLKDSGVLSEKGFSAIQEANKSYVPFYRMFDDGAGGPGSGGGRGLNVRNPVKKIKGGEQKLLNPIDSIVKNTSLFLSLAEKNRTLKSLVDLTDTADTGLIQKKKTKQRPIEVTSKEIQKFMDDHGFDVTLDGETFNIFRPLKKGALGADEFAVLRDGKTEIYTAPKDLVKAINSLERGAADAVIKLLALPASSLRAGATLAPDFMMRNLVRDQLTAYTQSKSGYIPVVDFAIGLKSLFKKDSNYWEWAKSGGINAHLVAMDQAYIRTNVWGLNKETGILSTTRNVIKSPFDVLRVVSETVENATRLGDYKKSRSKGKSARQAAFESREVTLDFARMGAKTQSMNMITAFWNAQVQGLDKMRRTFQENPVGTSAKVAAGITLPSIALWWVNHKDPRWQEIPRWQKDLFWIVMTDDHIYRIPKPFEWGILFGSLPERLMEAFFTENPKAFADFEQTMIEAFTPSLVPTFAVPIASQYANKNMFTGFPIIPRSKENVLPELQYSDYTSESAKILGKIAGQVPGVKDTSLSSPAIIENYISAWSGNLGKYALSLADIALEKAGVTQDKGRAETPLAQKPVIKAFMIRYPGASAQSIQDFYETQTNVEKIANSLKAIKEEKGDKAAEKFMKEHRSELAARAFLKKTRKALTTMHRFIDKIEANPKMTPIEKRQQIDGVYYKMIEAVKHANKTYEQIKKGKGHSNSQLEDDDDES